MIIQLNTKRIELIKDISNNLLIIKKYNLLNCKKVLNYSNKIFVWYSLRQNGWK